MRGTKGISHKLGLDIQQISKIMLNRKHIFLSNFFILSYITFFYNFRKLDHFKNSFKPIQNPILSYFFLFFMNLDSKNTTYIKQTLNFVSLHKLIILLTIFFKSK